MQFELCRLRRLERVQRNKKRSPAVVVSKAKAWSPAVSDLKRSDYVFKGRIGRASVGSAIFCSAESRFLFRLRAHESGNVTSSQVEVFWKTIRRKIRRFGVNFRRVSLNLRLYPVLTKTKTSRPKGGRMGSGKSPVVDRTSPIKFGQTVGTWKEFRARPYRSFLEFRNAAKKLSLRSRGELSCVSF
jgi:ribosomal protein L16/L10AE